MFIVDGELELSGCSFEHNFADASGGAIFAKFSTILIEV